MSKSKKRFVAVGECMIELLHFSEDQLQIGFAGDTLNTAIYFARNIDFNDFQVDYMTALGDDPYSYQMLSSWQTEKIGHQYIQHIKNKYPGLYFIRTDAKGERQFIYYREESAARAMFQGEQGEWLCAQLAQFDYIYFSGISLAILDATSRDKFYLALQKAKVAGAVISFDSNFRESLWNTKSEAKAVIAEFMPLVSIALPSFLDEQQLYDDETKTACAHRIHQYGVTEVVIKNGDHPCLLSSDGQTQTVAIEKVREVVDTTAAGDSFNGTYLANRAAGVTPLDAMKKAVQVSAQVVQYPGAIIPQAMTE